MFDEAKGAVAAAESKTEETRTFIKQVRRITRRKYTPGESTHCPGGVSPRDTDSGPLPA